MTFESLQLAPALMKAVQDMGFETPTPIQQQAIPVVLSGVDLMAGAQTGTGKTGGFALPILHRLAQEHPAKNKRGRIIARALILAPTRELAAQIEESFRAFGKHLKLSTLVVYGGVSMNPQIQRLQRGVDILIATPGRLLDLYEQGFVDFSQIQTLVLDEADRMLDMGFIIDIRRILELLPKDRQSLLFSATFNDEIRELANQILRDPHTIEVTPRNTTVELIRQIAHPVARAKKLELLIQLIKENQWYQVLIFTRTKLGANKVSEVLDKNGIRSAALHGNKSQAARTAALKDFKSGRVQAMVATDIAARGIDIDQLACVVNYELPNISEDYVHRIGRTGRAGSEGVAISLVTVDEAGFMQQIEKFIRQPVEQIVIDGFAPGENEVGQPIVMGRQVLWGGIGKAPSRKSTASVVKAARQKLSQPRSSTRSRSGSSASKEGTGFGNRRRQRSEDGISRDPLSRFAGPETTGSRTRSSRDDAARGDTAFETSNSGNRRKPASSSRGEGRFSEGRRGESRPSEGRRGEGRPSEGRRGESRPSEGRRGESRPSEGRRGESRPSEGRRGEGRSSEGRRSESRPSGSKSGFKTTGSPRPTQKRARTRTSDRAS